MHLARKWRASSFSDIQGQDLAVRILQNNLYRGYFLPLYLYAGPRGSGKTSTARIFAAAANCYQLNAFREQPRETTIPCGSCSSCQALFGQAHPDVIEIDAASYTGVDNVRSIIDSASFLPVMGRKKLYIIDEAHMLSKAAFNAFLKILEEPPEATMFILATTDPAKIPSTVASRSLQIYFDRVAPETMHHHLERICQHEQIAYDEAGIDRIARAVDGSVRDAIQLIERVSLAVDAVTYDNVRSVLQEVDEQIIVTLLLYLARGDMSSCLSYVHEIQVHMHQPIQVWHQCVEGFRALLWGHFGIVSPVWHHIQEFYNVVHMYPIEVIRACLSTLYHYESYVLKTRQPQALYEMLLLELYKQIHHASQIHQTVQERQHHDISMVSSEQEKPTYEHRNASLEAEASQPDASHVWYAAVDRFEQGQDHLLASVFRQAYDVVWQDQQTLMATFDRTFQFYQDWMYHYVSTLEHAIYQLHGVTCSVRFQFTAHTQQSTLHHQHTPKNDGKQHQGTRSKQGSHASSSGQASHREYKPRNSSRSQSSRSAPRRRMGRQDQYEPIADIDNAEKWPCAHMLLEMFPGTVRRVKKRT